MLRRTDRPSHEEMSVKDIKRMALTERSHKLAQAERLRWLAVEIREEWDLFEWNAMFEGTNDVYRTELFSDRA